MIFDIVVGALILMYFTMTFLAVHNCIKYLYPLKVKKHLIIFFYGSVIGWAISQTILAILYLTYPYCLPDVDSKVSLWVMMEVCTFFDYMMYGTLGLMFFTLSVQIRSIAMDTDPNKTAWKIRFAYVVLAILIVIDLLC